MPTLDSFDYILSQKCGSIFNQFNVIYLVIYLVWPHQYELVVGFNS